MSSVIRFALIGRPVGHSASPAMHRAAFRAMGLLHTYEAIDCKEEAQVRTAMNLVRRGSFGGINVTVPYKKVAAEFADELDESARELGAVNTLVLNDSGKVVGHNTDSGALVEELKELGAGTSSAVIVGSGGAALAAFAACKTLGVRVIGVTTRSWQTSEILYENETAERFRELGALTVPWPGERKAPAASNLSTAMRLQWTDLAAMADIVIQATSAGMDGGAPGDEVANIIPWARLAPSCVALDVVYGRQDTPFVQAAKERNLRVAGGAGMLVRQGALALELWLGRKPPLGPMQNAVARHLGRPVFD